MDHHGLLNVLRTLSIACHTIQTARITNAHDWKWVHTPVITPESQCAYCLMTIRSNGIWFLGGGLTLPRLYGMMRIEQGGTIKFIFPSHPHDTGSGVLCLGHNLTGVSLLANVANLNDSPMGKHRIPLWYKQYWNHDCAAMRKYLADMGETQALRELDRL